MQNLITLILTLMILSMGFPTALGEEDHPLVVSATVIFTGEGTPLANGMVLIQNGKVVLLGGNLEIPEGARILSFPGETCITPGLIDAASTAGVIDGNCWAEHGAEVTSQLTSLNAVDLEAPAFARLAAAGVTTVYITPDPASVIGSRGAVVKTGGPEQERLLTREADLKATFGPESWRRGGRNHRPFGRTDLLSRRPVTRMGMSSVFREAFQETRVYEAARKAGSAPLEPVKENLLRVLRGELPLRIQARQAIDIWSAIRMTRDLGIPFMLEEGAEAGRCLPELKAANIPVIFGPVFIDPRGDRARSGEVLRPGLGTPARLVEAGLLLALTAGDLTGEDALPHQAGFAIRHGLSFPEALKATTVTPAALLGIADRVGRLASGLDADLVLWQGKPFSATSRPLLVLINGEVVYQDERAENQNNDHQASSRMEQNDGE